MERIIFSNIPMQKRETKLVYKAQGNGRIDYPEPVYFPVNALLAKKMQPGEKVKVVLLAMDSPHAHIEENVKLFQQELDAINLGIGAEIQYCIIHAPFEETKNIYEDLFRSIVKQVGQRASLIADITFGPKSLPIVLFSAFNFMEKFYGAEIENIVYGKVDFVPNENGEAVPQNPKLCEITSLYFLNSLFNHFEFESEEEATKALEILLS